MSPAVITLLVLLVMVVFFVTEKLPAALVSMLGGSVLVLCGIIEPSSSGRDAGRSVVDAGTGEACLK